MQTFLPYSDYIKTAQCLDYKRLGKQRVEAWQIYLTLTQGSRWKNHPAVLMWKGYEKALLIYGLNICYEWKKRGYKDTLYEKFEKEINEKYDGKCIYPGCILKPKWLLEETICLSHQSNLIRKFPQHYKKLWPDVPDNLSYFWPSKNIQEKVNV